MKLKYYNIPIYDTELTLVHITREDLETEEGVKRIKKIFKTRRIIPNSDEFIEDSRNKNSCGVTYSNKDNCAIVVIFLKLDCAVDNIICHEKRHIEDLVSDWYQLSDREALAYLAGFLGTLMYDFYRIEDNVIE